MLTILYSVPNGQMVIYINMHNMVLFDKVNGSSMVWILVVKIWSAENLIFSEMIIVTVHWGKNEDYNG